MSISNLEMLSPRQSDPMSLEHTPSTGEEVQKYDDQTDFTFAEERNKSLVEENKKIKAELETLKKNYENISAMHNHPQVTPVNSLAVLQDNMQENQLINDVNNCILYEEQIVNDPLKQLENKVISLEADQKDPVRMFREKRADEFVFLFILGKILASPFYVIYWLFREMTKLITSL